MHPIEQTDTATQNIDPNRLLYSLLFPAIIMPLAGWMFTVSLPAIRDDFGISAEVAAWIATAFSLPFMILMPVYGRISDGLGKRRLLLFGITLFGLGNLLAILSGDLRGLIFGRILQGIGASGIFPLSLALLTERFPPDQRGKAMGLYSTMGPVAGVIGPVLAGIIVSSYGWRLSFVPAVLFSLLALVVVYIMIPSSIRHIRFDFLRAFDWIGVALLATLLTLLLFYFSSQPITGVAAFRDWRLLAATLVVLVIFIQYEKRQTTPFIRLTIFKQRVLIIASIGAMLRMMALSGAMGFLMPLYLSDVVDLNPTQTGFFLLANPAAMIVVVRFAGGLSDRWGSRLIVMFGFSVISVVMVAFGSLPADASIYVLIGFMVLFGLGAGLMLATLHRAALNDAVEADLGASSGIYSMIRFLGTAGGTAIGGVLLQQNLDGTGGVLRAYQIVFLCYAGFAVLGVMIGTLLPVQRT